MHVNESISAGFPFRLQNYAHSDERQIVVWMVCIVEHKKAIVLLLFFFFNKRQLTFICSRVKHPLFKYTRKKHTHTHCIGSHNLHWTLSTYGVWCELWTNKRTSSSYSEHVEYFFREFPSARCASAFIHITSVHILYITFQSHPYNTARCLIIDIHRCLLVCDPINIFWAYWRPPHTQHQVRATEYSRDRISAKRTHHSFRCPRNPHKRTSYTGKKKNVNQKKEKNRKNKMFRQWFS